MSTNQQSTSGQTAEEPHSSNGPPGTNKASSKRRNRPPKSQRTPQDWSTQVDAEEKANLHHQRKDGPSGKRKNNKNSPKDIMAPQPGKYPVVFPATTKSSPAFIEHTHYDVSMIFSQCAEMWDIVAHNNQVATYQAHIVQAQQQPVAAVAKAFVATSGLCTSQQIVSSHKVNSKPFAGLSYVDKTDLTHFEPLQQVANQYGYVINNETGTQYDTPNILETHQRFVRTANRIWNLADASPADVASVTTGTGWIPISANDRSCDQVILDGIRTYLREQGIFWFHPEDFPLFNHTPQFDTLPEEVRNALDQFYGEDRNRPATQAQWLELLNELNRDFLTASGLGAPIDAQGNDRDYIADDAQFRTPAETRADWENVVNGTSPIMQVMPEFLKCLSGKSARSDTGSLSMFGLTSKDMTGDVAMFTSETPIDAGAASLEWLYPVKSRTLHHVPAHVIMSVVTDTEHIRRQWLISHLK